MRLRWDCLRTNTPDGIREPPMKKKLRYQPRVKRQKRQRYGWQWYRHEWAPVQWVYFNGVRVKKGGKIPVLFRKITPVEPQPLDYSAMAYLDREIEKSVRVNGAFE